MILRVILKRRQQKFEVWIFLLNRASFAGRSATIGEVRTWLKEVGGIHLYHRGLRVRPYGDPGHDWLDMNLSRSRDPELRPSTNTSVGLLTVLDENEVLIPKTDRTGFVENESFRQLRQFGMDVLDWMHDERLADREKHKENKREQIAERSRQADQKLQQVIGSLPVTSREVVKQAAKEFEVAVASERDQLRIELALYQTLASVGTAVSVFAHEIEGPATDLTASIAAVERRSRKALTDGYQLIIGKQVESVKRSAEKVARFATLPLALLRSSKRRRSALDVNKTVGATVDLFRPYLQDAHIKTVCEFCDETVYISGSVASVEAIVSNLITNTVKAFRRPGSKLIDRKLVVRTSFNEERALIVVLDNGPGIISKLGVRIWLPGVTCDENGTGLGLTIVRDTVAELGGNVKAISRGELGGAEFSIDLPRRLT